MEVRVGNSGFAGLGIVTLVVGVFIAADLFIAQVIPGQEGFFFDISVRPERLLYAALATVPWLVALGILRAVRQPKQPPAAPATQDLPAEAPAIQNMLVNDFEPTREALPATVLDLAARGVIDIEEAGQDRFHVRLRERASLNLLPFEHRVMNLLRSRAVDGVVPTEALTTGPSKQSRRWWKDFRSEVIGTAQAYGLSTDLWNFTLLASVLLLSIPSVILWWIAFGDWIGGVWYLFLVAAVIGMAVERRRQRDTPAGLQAASRGLGLRRYLREGAFDDLPPTAVTIWERYLAYAAAMGVAHTAIRAIPMGADDDRRAWSLDSGDWRLVRVRYPNWWPPGWGKSPVHGILSGLWQLALSGGLLYWILAYGWLGDELADVLPEPAVLPVRAAVLAVAGVAAIVGTRALVQIMRAFADLGTPIERKGTVLRIRTYGGDSDARHYVAIDDGRSDTIRAFRMGPALRWTRLVEGRRAAATTTKLNGHVRILSELPPPQPRRATSASAS